MYDAEQKHKKPCPEKNLLIFAAGRSQVFAPGIIKDNKSADCEGCVCTGDNCAITDNKSVAKMQCFLVVIKMRENAYEKISGNPYSGQYGVYFGGLAETQHQPGRQHKASLQKHR